MTRAIHLKPQISHMDNFYDTFMVLLHPFWNVKTPASILCNCMEINRYIPQNFSFHVPHMRS